MQQGAATAVNAFPSLEYNDTDFKGGITDRCFILKIQNVVCTCDSIQLSLLQHTLEHSSGGDHGWLFPFQIRNSSGKQMHVRSLQIVNTFKGPATPLGKAMSIVWKP
jgi:hypothetical protein